MKPLLQSDFPLVLIEDLGTKYISEKSKSRKRFALFLCPICKQPFEAITANVKNFRTSKCRSCATTLAKTKHGESNKSKLNAVWKGMRQRCNNPKNKNYKYYGKKGISVCSEWEDYSTFKDWALQNGYKDGLSIDRIDSDKNYEPSNCRWATATTQARNTSVSNRSTYKGVYFRNDTGKWRAMIGVNYKNISIGQFDTDVEAAMAYNKYIIDHSLEHTLNIIKEKQNE